MGIKYKTLDAAVEVEASVIDSRRFAFEVRKNVHKECPDIVRQDIACLRNRLKHALDYLEKLDKFVNKRWPRTFEE